MLQCAPQTALSERYESSVAAKVHAARNCRDANWSLKGWQARRILQGGLVVHARRRLRAVSDAPPTGQLGAIGARALRWLLALGFVALIGFFSLGTARHREPSATVPEQSTVPATHGGDVLVGLRKGGEIDCPIGSGGAERSNRETPGLALWARTRVIF